MILVDLVVLESAKMGKIKCHPAVKEARKLRKRRKIPIIAESSQGRQGIKVLVKGRKRDNA